MKERLGLIDGDIYIFAAAVANEYDCQWGDWLWTRHADLDAAIAQLEDTLEGIQKTLGLNRMVVALSDKANFRKGVMPTYKYNRVGKPKPVVYQAMREYVQEVWPTYLFPSLEADDVLGILMTGDDLEQGDKVIISIDKDMMTIPGKVWNTKKEELFEITVEEADHAHLIQTLTGDSTDGYSGCPRIGPVKAERLLADTPPEDKWELITMAYDKAGLSEEVALMNARVARILRAGDYSQEEGVKLWTPETK